MHRWLVSKLEDLLCSSSGRKLQKGENFWVGFFTETGEKVLVSIYTKLFLSAEEPLQQ